MKAKIPNRKSIPVTLTIEKELLATVDHLADAQNLTRSQFIVRMIRTSIEQEKTMVALMANPNVAAMVVKTFGNVDALKEMGKAMKDEVDEKQLEVFSRKVEGLHESAAEVVRKNKTKGDRS